MNLREMFIAANPLDGEQMLEKALRRRQANKIINAEIESQLREQLEKEILDDMTLMTSGNTAQDRAYAKAKLHYANIARGK